MANSLKTQKWSIFPKQQNWPEGAKWPKRQKKLKLAIRSK